MIVSELIRHIEQLAPPSLQEAYDNAGLIYGNPAMELTGILIALDATEAVIEEAIRKNCNLVVTHHPIVFSGLKRFNEQHYVDRALVKAIRHEIALYACHTNLDNTLHGVNGAIAAAFELQQVTVLAPKPGQLLQLSVYVPNTHIEQVKSALFEAGAGTLGNYKQCSFSALGLGSFTPTAGAQPHIGTLGIATTVEETKLELVFPVWTQSKVIQALHQAHPYETPAYNLFTIQNLNPEIGSGVVGYLPQGLSESDWLAKVAKTCKVPVVRHSPLLGKQIEKIAICGGAGSFLIKQALALGADALLTADLKYHEFFEANDQILLTDPGHFESEHFTIDLLYTIIQEKFPTFAVLKSSIQTNPVHYYIGH
jgi:dinuclear metal center YbgI/SA1388 family protein